MATTTDVPVYTLRGIPLLGWRNINHAVTFLAGTEGIRHGTLVAINAEKMLMLEDNAQVRELIQSAEFKYADGISVVRSIRKKFSGAQISRVPGADLWEALMSHAGKHHIPVFLIGGKPDVLTQTVAQVQSRWGVNVVGSQNGYFQAEHSEALFNKVRQSGAQIVTVAMGSPRQELFIRDCRTVWPNALYMGVGGTYDVFVGHIKRAPKVWQDLGLEWLYRLLSQPGRITRQLRLLRYLSWHYRGQM